jgi:Ser/Thr protein kinase RdoA (MazF antagonist)
MEMLEHDEGWEVLCSCEDAAALLPEVELALRRAHGVAISDKQQQQQQRGVHGDMRGANVLVRRAGRGGALEVRFVDFDWAGPAGKVVYPPFMHHQIQWHPQARTCLHMLQEHDLHLLLCGQR